MKKLVTTLLVAILLCASVTSFAAPPSAPTSEYQVYVNDYTDTMLAADAKAMQEMGAILEERAKGAQVVAVIVDGLDGMDSDIYIEKLFTDWEIGSTSESNGVLLLLAISDREYRVAVGSGLIRSLSQTKADEIVEDSAIDAFIDGDYSKGMRNAYIALCEEVARIYGVSLAPNTTNAGTTRQSVDITGSTASYRDAGVTNAPDPSVSLFGGFLLGGVILLTLIIIFLIIINLFRGISGGYGRRDYAPRRSGMGWLFPMMFLSNMNRHHHTPPHRGGFGGAPRPPMGGGFGGFGGSSRGGGGSFGGSAGRSFGGSSRGGGGSFGKSSGRKF